MSHLDSFHADARVAVIGASGGIGAALVEQLVALPTTGRVFAFGRRLDEQSDSHIHLAPIDITRERTVREAAAVATSEGPLDLVIVATGILHNNNGIFPEKSLRNIDAGVMADVLRINTIGPSLVAKHFLPCLRPGHKSVFAALSARVGSIGDNRLGGWTSYRASKAALNMVLKTLSIEHARRFPDSVVIGLHPGTVDTRLSRPFQRNVADGKLFSASQSAGYLLDVIEQVTPDDTGSVFAWDGSRIAE
ncbi:MAG: SDR family NAD(P)-dependent oxidoreductase [Woeseiaceae bacterium]|nr:SDR family NAD(P)-dependent oxidoreductase [Woeseiaceae bacterium]